MVSGQLSLKEFHHNWSGVVLVHYCTVGEKDLTVLCVAFLCCCSLLQKCSKRHPTTSICTSSTMCRTILQKWKSISLTVNRKLCSFIEKDQHGPFLHIILLYQLTIRWL